MIGETDWASSSSSFSWGWLWRTSSSSSLKGLSSPLGKFGFVVKLGSFGRVDEEDSNVGVLMFRWRWSSVASNGCDSKKLVENGAKKKNQ